MDPQYYSDLEELFATNGWRRVVRDAEEAIRNREQQALVAGSWEHVCFLRGEATQLASIVTLEQQVALQKAQEDEEE